MVAATGARHLDKLIIGVAKAHVMAERADYYSVLGVPYNATPEQITIAFSQQVERFPEEARDPNSNAAFRLLITAYKILNDADSRAAFDQTLGTQAITGGPRPLNIQLLASQTTLPSLKETQIQYVLLEIVANPELLQKRTPVNFCLVIDRSTSMNGDRINRVKAAASLIADQLEPEDTISVVVFSDFAEIVAPADAARNIQLIKAKISQISTGGATEILKGLRLGLFELHKTRKASGINHLVLLTDGHTYGDEKACVELAERAAQDDISISAVGIGHKWNDQFLDELVAPSGSSSAYLESPELIVSHLQERIRSLSRTFAHSIQLELEATPGLEVRAVNRLAPSPRTVNWEFQEVAPLGSLQHNIPLTVLIELGVHPRPADTTAHLKTKISASVVPTNQRNLRFYNDLRFMFSRSPATKPPLPAVVRAVNKLTLYKLNEKVWEDVEQGEVEKASARMERLATRLHSAGQPQLAATALREAQMIARTGKLSAAGRKELKYGTRSLISMSIDDL